MEAEGGTRTLLFQGCSLPECAYPPETSGSLQEGATGAGQLDHSGWGHAVQGMGILGLAWVCVGKTLDGGQAS